MMNQDHSYDQWGSLSLQESISMSYQDTSVVFL